MRKLLKAINERLAGVVRTGKMQFRIHEVGTVLIRMGDETGDNLA